MLARPAYGRRAVLATLLWLVLGVLVAGAWAGQARAQSLPMTDASFELEPVDGCVVYRCSPTVLYSSGFVAGGYRVEVDWDLRGPPEQAFAAETALTCGDSTLPDASPDSECVVQGPPYQTAGIKTVVLRVTGPDGVAVYAGHLLNVVESLRNPKPAPGRGHDRGLCPPAQRGVHCGPGNNRRTAGGGGKVSHKGWPAVSGIFWIVQDGRGHANGAGSPLNDEILGGHGSDTLRGGAGRDILWADYHPTGNTPRQHDALSGGPDADFIYTSHGTNYVRGGAGRDRIYAHWGHGTIDCGSGNDWVGVNNYAMHYRLRNCEHRVQW